jgi:hypothetical protein
MTNVKTLWDWTIEQFVTYAVRRAVARLSAGSKHTVVMVGTLILGALPFPASIPNQDFG